MDVAMIYRGRSPHSAHRGFAESIDADLLGLDRRSLPGARFGHSILEEIFNGIVLPEYDVYIVEGTRALYGAITNQIISDAICIYLAGDQALYKLLDDEYDHESIMNRIISEYGMDILQRLCERYVDGVIAVSEFSAEYTSRIIEDKPMRVVNPFIKPDIYKRLGAVSPDINKNTAVTVGAYTRYKGQDILAQAWSLVRKKIPDAELHLIGSGYPTQLNEIDGVSTLGFVDDLPEALANTSLYVQPSRIDNFPVSVLEAMRAGIPPIVTDTTGNKSVVSKIDEKLITTATQAAIAESIVEYFRLSNTVRCGYEEKAREIGGRFDSRSQKQLFRNEFYSIFEDITSTLT